MSENQNCHDHGLLCFLPLILSRNMLMRVYIVFCSMPVSGSLLGNGCSDLLSSIFVHGFILSNL